MGVNPNSSLAALEDGPGGGLVDGLGAEDGHELGQRRHVVRGAEERVGAGEEGEEYHPHLVVVMVVMMVVVVVPVRYPSQPCNRRSQAQAKLAGTFGQG